MLEHPRLMCLLQKLAGSTQFSLNKHTAQSARHRPYTKKTIKLTEATRSGRTEVMMMTDVHCITMKMGVHSMSIAPTGWKTPCDMFIYNLQHVVAALNLQQGAVL